MVIDWNESATFNVKVGGFGRWMATECWTQNGVESLADAVLAANAWVRAASGGIVTNHVKDIKNCEICANPTEWVPCDSKRNPYAAVCADTHCLVCLQAYGCEVRGFEHPVH